MPETISLKHTLRDMLNETIKSETNLLVMQIDGNSISGTPPALIVVATANQAQRLQQILSEFGIRDNKKGSIFLP